MLLLRSLRFLFFNDTAPPEISPLPLHDALPILRAAFFKPLLRVMAEREARTVGAQKAAEAAQAASAAFCAPTVRASRSARSEEHTSELQSHLNLVCRLLLEKKKNKTTSAQPALS